MFKEDTGRKEEQNMSEDNTDMNDTATVSAIDAALMKARARKALKDGGGDATSASLRNTPATPFAPKKAKGATKAPREPKVGPTEEEKLAKKLAKDEERAAKKGARDQARAEKKATQAANRKPAHLAKVERARGNLPALSEKAQMYFDDISANSSTAEVAALSSHLAFHNRFHATQAAVNTRFNVGDEVTITGGDSKNIGKAGTVTKCQRIRMYVSVPGAKKDIYLFTSDCALATAAASKQAAIG